MQENLEQLAKNIDWDFPRTDSGTGDIRSESTEEEALDKVMRSEHLPGRLDQKGLTLPVNNFRPRVKPKTEAELIEYVKALSRGCQISVIMAYYELGSAILSFYQKDYGNSVTEKIAEEIDLHPDTLRKIVKFAKTYTRGQVDQLLSGSFTVSWTSIAQNLTIEPQKVLEAYSTTGTVGEFHMVLGNVKGARVTPGKTENGSNDIANALISVGQSETSSLKSPNSVSCSVPAEVISDQANSVSIESSNDRTVAVLRSEIERLQSEVQKRSAAYENLDLRFEVVNQELKEKEDCISAARELIDQVIDMCREEVHHNRLESALTEVLDTLR